jgi:hypothetical protein
MLKRLSERYKQEGEVIRRSWASSGTAFWWFAMSRSRVSTVLRKTQQRLKSSKRLEERGREKQRVGVGQEKGSISLREEGLKSGRRRRVERLQVTVESFISPRNNLEAS